MFQLRLHPEKIVSVHLVIFLVARLLDNFVDLILVLLELDIALHNVDVGSLK